MGSLIEYFKKKTAKNVLEKSIDHALKVQQCVKELNKGMICLLEERDFEKADKFFNNVDFLEGEADSLRRDILSAISKGELNPSVRTDLSHLIKRLDDVANCANGVARRIRTIPMDFWIQSSSETINYIIEMMNLTVKVVDYLDKIVIDLLGERENVKEFASHINNLEHQVDNLNIELRKSLQKTSYDVNYFTIFTVGNTIESEMASKISIVLPTVNIVK
jgi:predicted phosphate transport protein (TIGR00153 family)